MHLPVALLPESEALHLFLGVAERRVAVRSAFEIDVSEFGEVGLDNLIGVDENDFLYVEGEEDVEEKDLVAPNDTLLFGLVMEPARPLVLDKFVVKVVFLGVVGQEAGELGGEIVAQKPEFNLGLCVPQDGQHHDSKWLNRAS